MFEGVEIMNYFSIFIIYYLFNGIWSCYFNEFFTYADKFFIMYRFECSDERTFPCVRATCDRHLGHVMNGIIFCQNGAFDELNRLWHNQDYQSAIHFSILRRQSLPQ